MFTTTAEATLMSHTHLSADDRRGSIRAIQLEQKQLSKRAIARYLACHLGQSPSTILPRIATQSKSGEGLLAKYGLPEDAATMAESKNSVGADHSYNACPNQSKTQTQTV